VIGRVVILLFFLVLFSVGVLLLVVYVYDLYQGVKRKQRCDTDNARAVEFMKRQVKNKGKKK